MPAFIENGGVSPLGSGVKTGSWKIEGAQLNLLNLTYSKVSGTIFFGLTEKLGIPQGGVPPYPKLPKNTNLKQFLYFVSRYFRLFDHYKIEIIP